jgi:hypothetical protein
MVQGCATSVLKAAMRSRTSIPLGGFACHRVRCRGEDAVAKAPHSASASHPLRGRWRPLVGQRERAKTHQRTPLSHYRPFHSAGLIVRGRSVRARPIADDLPSKERTRFLKSVRFGVAKRDGVPVGFSHGRAFNLKAPERVCPGRPPKPLPRCRGRDWTPAKRSESSR